MTDQQLAQLAAEKVMGWTVRTTRGGRLMADTPEGPIALYENDVMHPWNPCESIADSWMLVEAMRGQKWLVTVKSMPPESSFILEGSRSEYDAPAPDRLVGEGKCCCELTYMGEPWRHSEYAIADTAPRAITLAALCAVGVAV